MRSIKKGELHIVRCRTQREATELYHALRKGEDTTSVGPGPSAYWDVYYRDTLYWVRYKNTKYGNLVHFESDYKDSLNEPYVYYDSVREFLGGESDYEIY
jgi:hypothetical protein